MKKARHLPGERVYGYHFLSPRRGNRASSALNMPNGISNEVSRTPAGCLKTDVYQSPGLRPAAKILDPFGIGTATAERSYAMPELEYDDPEVEEKWCCDQLRQVAEYLHSQRLKHGRIGEWPAWHIAPYVSIWAIESHARPESIGWWAICGDLPTDYISSGDVIPPQHPRKALRVFARNWLELVEAWKAGREIENTRIGDSSSHETLAPLLAARAHMLMKWTEDDSLWEEE